jgi:hypothetical protein
VPTNASPRRWYPRGLARAESDLVQTGGSYVALGPSCKYPPSGGVRITARARDELGLANRHREGALGDESGGEGLVVARASGARRWLIAQVLVAPLSESEQGDVKVKPHARELVVVAILSSAV